MNEQVVLLAIGMVVAAFILWPFVRKRSVAPRRASPGAARAQAGDVPASEELAELELDRAMGRVSDEDYARFRADLDARAPVTAAALPDEAPPSDARARAEALVQKWREAPRPTCPTCGERPEPAARFCSTCGRPLA